VFWASARALDEAPSSVYQATIRVRSLTTGCLMQAGVVGIAAKPLAGTFDLISQTADGIKNTTTFFKERKKGRIRIPRYSNHFLYFNKDGISFVFAFGRYIGEDKVLLPYNKEKSEGKYVLYHVDDEAHSNEHYLWHIVGKIKGEINPNE